MDRLADLEAFLAIVEQGSQTGAARQLHRSLQSINRSLAALESSAGVELVRRSTRRSNVTEAGLRYYQRVRPAFLELHAARRELTMARGEPSGVLRSPPPCCSHRPTWRPRSANSCRAIRASKPS